MKTIEQVTDNFTIRAVWKFFVKLSECGYKDDDGNNLKILEFAKIFDHNYGDFGFSVKFINTPFDEFNQEDILYKYYNYEENFYMVLSKDNLTEFKFFIG